MRKIAVTSLMRVVVNHEKITFIVNVQHKKKFQSKNSNEKNRNDAQSSKQTKKVQAQAASV